MPGRLQAEIKQHKPFPSLEEEAYLNLVRTTEVLRQGMESLLKQASLSPSQYNVLRILAGSPEGLPCTEIGNRMVNRDPDVTRLLDRLERRELVMRSRHPRDRRVIITCITAGGLELLQQLRQPVLDLQRQQLGHLGSANLRQLIELLEQVRGGPEE